MEREQENLLVDIDSYIEGLFAPSDEALEAALEETRRAGLPEIQVSPNQGKLLGLLVEISGVRRILEVGALGGYSTIHLARALPEGGALISLELEERNAEVARENIRRAGLGERTEVRVGDARVLLSEMVERDEGPFDFVFIDADKASYPEYLKWAMKLTRSGSLILADNTIRGGGVLDPKDDSSRGAREYNQMVSEDGRLSATILPFFKSRVDGLTVARVL